MTDFNKLLTPGDIDAGVVNTVVEISEGSILKIEYRRETATFELDRVEPPTYPKPTNYGFIPQTFDGDGDELDTLIVCAEKLPTGIHLAGRVVGIMNFEDDGEVDHKVIIATDKTTKTIEDLGPEWKAKVTDHFTHYKDHKKPGTTIVKGWGDVEEAKKVIRECIERFQSSTSK
jgi:inorganic pyrophosphatase